MDIKTAPQHFSSVAVEIANTVGVVERPSRDFCSRRLASQILKLGICRWRINRAITCVLKLAHSSALRDSTDPHRDQINAALPCQ